MFALNCYDLRVVFRTWSKFSIFLYSKYVQSKEPIFGATSEFNGDLWGI